MNSIQAMKTIISGAVALGSILLAVPGAVAVEYTETFEWTAVYDGSALPLDASSIQYADGTTGGFHGALDDPENLNAALRNGVLAIDSENRGVFAIDAGQEGRFLLNTDIGYTAEFRARLIETVNLTSDLWNINGANLQLNDGRMGTENRHTVHLGMFTHPTTGENYARVRAGALSPAVRIGREFHTYTFVTTSDGVSFYFDGYLVAELPRWAVVERPEVWLGNFQSGGNHVAHFEVDYLKVYDGGAIHPVDLGPIDAGPVALMEPRPEVSGFGRDGDDFVLDFQTVLGGEYLVESRDDLRQEAPNEPSIRVVGDGGTGTARDSMAGVDRRFYQVKRQPETIVYEQEFDWDFRYEGDVDPLASDAIQYGDGTTGEFTVFRTVAGKYRTEDGILQIEMPVGQTQGGAFEVSAAQFDRFLVDADDGYTIEYRVRVDHSLHYGAVFLEMNPWDGQHFAGVGVVTVSEDIIDEETEEVIGTRRVNVARLQSAGGNVLTDYPLGTGFNTFTLIGDRNTVTLFINGIEVASTSEILTTANRDFLRFGSTTGATNTSRSDIDYIRVYTGGAVRPVPPQVD